MRTRTSTCPDRETDQWCTQQVITRNEQVIHRRLAQGTRQRVTLEAAWPSREEAVGRVLIDAMMYAGREPFDVRAARVVLRREAASEHGFVVQATFPVYL
ncbi:hypothetical protein OG900_23685 [Streptomyces sp. NBC_00433]